MKKISFITLVLCTLMLPSISCMKKLSRFRPQFLRKSYSSKNKVDIYSELRNILHSSNFQAIQFYAVEDKIYKQKSLNNYKIYLQFLTMNCKKIKEKDNDEFDEIPSKMVPLLIAHFPTQGSWMNAWLDKLGENLLDNAPITQTLLECLIEDNDSLAISKLLNYFLEKGKDNKVKTKFFLTNLFDNILIKENEPNIYLIDFALKTKKYKAAYRILRFLKDRLRKNLKIKYTKKIKDIRRLLDPELYTNFMRLITS